MARARSSSDQTRQSALEVELAKIERDFGRGSIIRSSAMPEHVEVVSTGSLSLDRATGIGGLPRGKIVEILGWESSGKSTICLQTIANAQRLGLNCLLVDGENSFDASYATSLGVDVNRLLYQQLDEGGAEKCYAIADRLMRTKEIGLVVFDSQTSLLPKRAFDTEIGDSRIGICAKLMSETVPRIVNAAAIGNTLVIYISQLREKIGMLFGNPETTSGGNALRFYAHMRIDVRKSVVKKDDVAVANKTRCKVIKNKLAVPFREAEFKIIFGKGVDVESEILDLALERSIIRQNGSWYSYNGNNIAQGEANLTQMLRDNPEFKQEIIQRLNNEENTPEERQQETQELQEDASNNESQQGHNREDQAQERRADPNGELFS